MSYLTYSHEVVLPLLNKGLDSVFQSANDKVAALNTRYQRCEFEEADKLLLVYNMGSEDPFDFKSETLVDWIGSQVFHELKLLNGLPRETYKRQHGALEHSLLNMAKEKLKLDVFQYPNCPSTTSFKDEALSEIELMFSIFHRDWLEKYDKPEPVKKVKRAYTPRRRTWRW